MKKWIVFWIVFVIAVLVTCSVSAEEGVVIISPDSSDTASTSFDDMKLNTPVEIPDYAQITLTSFDYYDKIDCYYSYYNTESGQEADFAGLRLDIQNLSLLPIDYRQEISAMAVHKDKYEFECFVSQYDYDKSDKLVITSDHWFEISPLYEGHYIIRCQLPKAVVADKTGSLHIIFMLGENEFTYKIRK